MELVSSPDPTWCIYHFQYNTILKVIHAGVGLQVGPLLGSLVATQELNKPLVVIAMSLHSTTTNLKARSMQCSKLWVEQEHHKNGLNTLASFLWALSCNKLIFHWCSTSVNER